MKNKDKKLWKSIDLAAEFMFTLKRLKIVRKNDHIMNAGIVKWMPKKKESEDEDS